MANNKKMGKARGLRPPTPAFCPALAPVHPLAARHHLGAWIDPAGHHLGTVDGRGHHICSFITG